MKIRSLLLTVGTISVIFLLLPLSMAAQAASSVIYGYVSMDGVPINGANVTITRTTGDGMDQQAVTENDSVSGNPGYYSFNITMGSGYSITASYHDRSTTVQWQVSVAKVRADLNILSVTPTPKPTVTTTPTPTPRPSGELGGPVKRNNESYFTPMAATNPSPTPMPMVTSTPTPMPTLAATPIPTAAPSSGISSNIYVLIVIVLVAIVALAAAALYLWQRY